MGQRFSLAFRAADHKDMRLVFCALMMSGLLPRTTGAAVVEFVVDPGQTQWSMRGAYYPGGPAQGDFEPQSPGSHITALSGVIRVDLTPTTIQFLPSLLTAAVQPTPQAPGPGGAAGTAPANFGMAAPTLPTPTFPTPVFAVRDFSFSIASPPIPLVEFDGRQQFADDIEAMVNARLDFDIAAGEGTYVLDNWLRGFDDDNVGRLSTDGMLQTLQMHNYLGDIFPLLTPADSFVEWAGPIVATRIVPEPASIMLLAAAALSAGFMCRYQVACRRTPSAFLRA
jgi:hypothetical protein